MFHERIVKKIKDHKTLAYRYSHLNNYLIRKVVNPFYFNLPQACFFKLFF